MNRTPIFETDPIYNITEIEKLLGEQNESLNRLVMDISRNKRRRLVAGICKAGVIVAGVLLFGKLIANDEKSKNNASDETEEAPPTYSQE